MTIWGVLGLLGALGGISAAALWLFGGAAILLTFNGVVAFLRTPVGKALLIIGIVAVAWVWSDRRATHRERARCEAQKQESIDAALKVDREAQAEAVQRMQQQVLDSDAAVRELKREITTYAKLGKECPASDRAADFINGVRRNDHVPGRSAKPPRAPKRHPDAIELRP